MAPSQQAQHLRAVPDRPLPTPRKREPRPHSGHGQRLLAAIDAVETFPVLADARKRVLSGAADPRGASELLVQTVESDLALALTVLRAVNRGKRPSAAIGSVREAVATLGPIAVAKLARELPSSDFFQATPSFGISVDSVRLHAVAVKQMSLRLAVRLARTDYDELVVIALLHDVGKLVLRHALGDYPEVLLHGAETPEQQVRAELAALGFDHAIVGGLVARRAGLPPRIAAAIEHHHREDALEAAAVVRLADMLVHYAGGQIVGSKSMLQAAHALGIGATDLRKLMYELPNTGDSPSRGRPSPLTPRELAVLRKLADGKLYKQIATELGRSTSTIRTHLHNIYAKLEVYDRAQAVLLATEQGWI